MRILLSVLLVLLLVPTYSTVPRVPLLGARARMRIAPVPLSTADPGQRRIGRLTFLGGVRLTSPDPAFGGYSSLFLDDGRATLLSDSGNAITFGIARGRLVAPQFANLPDGPGSGWEKRDRDSESMTRDPATGQIWVGFEFHNAIWRYAAGFSRAEAHIEPPQMADWPPNGGPESLVRLRNGRFLVIGETAHGPHGKGRQAILFAGDPTRDVRHGFRFVYLPPPGYDPSDVTELPRGDLLVLNRRFQLPYDFTAIMTVVRRRAIRPGAVVTGTPIARFAAPVIHDNFEGLAITREAGATIVWMCSDDNQSMLQRSLLLKFRLDPQVG